MRGPDVGLRRLSANLRRGVVLRRLSWLLRMECPAPMDKPLNRWIIPLTLPSQAAPNAMRKLRIALIWMLMLALPAQSMAAIGMQLCALTQGESGQVTAHHGAMAQHADAAAHIEHHATADMQQASDSSLCSLCAFCVGAVALSTVVISSSPLQAAEASLLRLDRFIGFIAETPERPPRLFLV